MEGLRLSDSKFCIAITSWFSRIRERVETRVKELYVQVLAEAREEAQYDKDRIH